MHKRIVVTRFSTMKIKGKAVFVVRGARINDAEIITDRGTENESRLERLPSIFRFQIHRQSLSLFGDRYFEPFNVLLFHARPCCFYRLLTLLRESLKSTIGSVLFAYY